MKSQWSLLALVLTVIPVNGTPEAACETLQSVLPGRVFFPGSEDYIEDNEHYYGSSSEASICSVQPESAAEVGTILQIVGSGNTQSQFGIKSGGHGIAVGFSSTSGVQISLSRLHELTYDATSSTVKIGSGLTWDQVYKQLEPFGVAVAGGRVPGVGVGGLLLGGGYSYFTDEHGLSIDNIVAHDLVLPNGTFVEVTDESDPDLFYALKGGFNNFGIVTAFTMKTYPQADIWLANVINPANSSAAVQAIADWSLNNNDLKGVVAPFYAYAGGQLFFVTSMMYNAPLQPSIFDAFFNVPDAQVQVSGVMSLVEAGEVLYGGFVGNPARGSKHTVPVTYYTVPLIEEMLLQTDKIVSDAEANNRTFTAVNLVIEPYSQPFAHSKPSAYPHPPPPARFVCPTMLEAHWENAADDEYFKNALEMAYQAILVKAVAEGQSMPGDVMYNNYAPPDTPVEELYGAENLAKLRAIRERVDPGRVMALAGGFKI